MSDRPPVAPYLTVSPCLGAITFYAAAFGAVQKALMPSLDGLRIMHCELSINGGSVFVADAFPEFGKARSPIPGEPVTVSVSLEFDASEKVDEAYKRATALGATGEMGPTNSFWGTRFAVIRDPFGHRWMMNGPLASSASAAEETRPKAEKK
jgi:PhnB protein